MLIECFIVHFVCWSSVVDRVGYSCCRGLGFESAWYSFHRENSSPKYFGTYTIWHWKCPGQRLEIKKEMFRPIAVRNQLTTPYGRKVLGNLKQGARKNQLSRISPKFYPNIIASQGFQIRKHFCDIFLRSQDIVKILFLRFFLTVHILNF